MNPGTPSSSGDETVHMNASQLPSNPQPFPPALICPNCLTPIPTGYSFCPKCGMAVSQPAQPVYSQAQPVYTYPQGYVPQPPVKKAPHPILWVLAGLGALILVVLIALLIITLNQPPAVPWVAPTASPEISTRAAATVQVIEATATARQKETEQAKPLPTQTPTLAPFSDNPSPEEVVTWFMKAIIESPETYQGVISEDGVTSAPGFTGCESGDCFPVMTPDETVALIEAAKIMSSKAPVCVSYVAYENQVLINLSDLPIDREKFLPGYGEDFGAYIFGFYRDDASHPYRLSSIIGIQEFMMDSIQAGSNDYLACP